MDRETRRAKMVIPGIVVRDGVRDTVVGELDPDGGSCVDLHGMRARWVLRDRGNVESRGGRFEAARGLRRSPLCSCRWVILSISLCHERRRPGCRQEATCIPQRRRAGLLAVAKGIAGIPAIVGSECCHVSLSWGVT